MSKSILFSAVFFLCFISVKSQIEIVDFHATNCIHGESCEYGKLDSARIGDTVYFKLGTKAYCCRKFIPYVYSYDNQVIFSEMRIGMPCRCRCGYELEYKILLPEHREFNLDFLHGDDIDDLKDDEYAGQIIKQYYAYKNLFNEIVKNDFPEFDKQLNSPRFLRHGFDGYMDNYFLENFSTKESIRKSKELTNEEVESVIEKFKKDMNLQGE
jgi:hypothetical protein